MSASSAELTLIMKARNLAGSAIADVKTSLGGIESKAKTAGSALSNAFAGQGARLARELGDVVTNLLNGQDFSSAAVNLGATLAGGLAAAFGEQLIARLAGSTFIAGIATSLTVAGEGIGALISAAIPIGMAALPFLLVGAVVLAIGFLITHPEVAGKIAEVAGSIVGGIVSGIAGLVGGILGVFGQAFGAVVTAGATFVAGQVAAILAIPGRLVAFGGAILGVFATAFGAVAKVIGGIVDGVVSVIGGIIQKVKDALAWIDKLNGSTRAIPGGPANIAEGLAKPRASGGWIGLHGPELILGGERGPEYVTPNHELGNMGGAPVQIPIILDGREIGRVVDERLFYRAQTAPS